MPPWNARALRLAGGNAIGQNGGMNQSASRQTATLLLLGAAIVALAAVAAIVLLRLDAARDHPRPPSAAIARVTMAPPKPAPKPADERFTIKRILPIAGPIKYGEWHWDENGAPAGPLVITVDLEARVLSVFRGGYEIGATAVLLGTQDTPTPLGVFPIKYKDADHHSRTYDNAPMPFTMNLTGDGVSIHGTTVEKGYASHGCVGVPTPFARRLFGIARIGDRVYITRGKTIGAGDSLVG